MNTFSRRTFISTSLTLAAFLLFSCDDTKSDTYITPDSTLPLNVNVKDSPLMYDFTNGVVGWHNKDDSMMDKQITFVVNNSDGKVWSCERGKVEEEPCFSSSPVEVEFSTNEEHDNFIDLLNNNNISSNTEGSYTFFNVNEDFARDNSDIINMIDYSSVLASNYEQDYKSGAGFPTDLLRDKFSELINKNYKIDIKDKFWDKYNFGSYLKSSRIEKAKMRDTPYENLDTVVLRPWKTKAGYSFEVNGKDLNKDIKAIDKLLEESGFENISLVTEKKNYATKELYKEISKRSDA